MDVQQNFAVIGLGEFGIRICEMLVEGGGRLSHLIMMHRLSIG